MQKARAIIAASNVPLLMILIPNSGRLLINNGSNAQCIAQANEAPIPKASQFTLNFILKYKDRKKQQCCKIIYSSVLGKQRVDVPR